MIFAALKKSQGELEGEAAMCCYMCDSLHLGILLKSMKKDRLYMNAAAPYLGLDAESVVRKVSEFKTPSESICHRPAESFLLPLNFRCSVLGPNVGPGMHAAMSTLQGLALT